MLPFHCKLEADADYGNIFNTSSAEASEFVYYEGVRRVVWVLRTAGNSQSTTGVAGADGRRVAVVALGWKTVSSVRSIVSVGQEVDKGEVRE